MLFFINEICNYLSYPCSAGSIYVFSYTLNLFFIFSYLNLFYSFIEFYEFSVI